MLDKSEELKTKLINKYLGKQFTAGTFDCFDLIINWFDDLGYVVPDFKHSGYWNGETVPLDNYYQYWRRLEEVEKKQIYDVIFIRRNYSGGQYHIGIYLENNLFIHTTIEQGVVVSRLDRYKRVVNGHYRFRKIEEENG
jgi:cell wall-associated NlpC family hydrolase